MKITKTNQYNMNYERISCGLIHVNQSWSGIIIVTGNVIEIIMQNKKKNRTWKAYRPFPSNTKASNFAKIMDYTYPSLKSLSSIGFKTFN